jgi:hypothetical protein
MHEVMVKMFLLTIQALRLEGVRGSECIDPRFHDLRTSWKRVVGITLPQLYPRRKSPLYSKDGRLGGPRAGLDDMEK